jgi:integrase/recombinase XerD
VTALDVPVAALASVLQPVLEPQATSDEGMISLWLGLHVDRRNTVSAYTADARSFVRFVGKPLRSVTVRDVQAFKASLDGLADTSIARRLSAIKSLIGFAHRVGYIAFDVGAPVRLPALKNRLSERILSEADVLHLLRVAPGERNGAMLRLIYGAGLRVSEACGLCWRDVTPRTDGEGQINVFGKGGKTRTVLLPAALFERVCALRNGAGDGDPVFRSRGGGRLDPATVHRIFKSSAKRARISSAASVHWLRHAHASHALDRQCPIHLVQATLGHASVATTGMYLHVRPGDSSARYLNA